MHFVKSVNCCCMWVDEPSCSCYSTNFEENFVVWFHLNIHVCDCRAKPTFTNRSLVKVLKHQRAAWSLRFVQTHTNPLLSVLTVTEQAAHCANVLLVYIFSPCTVVSGSLNRTLRSPFRLWVGSVSDPLLGLGLFRMEVGTLPLVTWIRHNPGRVGLIIRHFKEPKSWSAQIFYKQTAQ